jgi:trans-2,3-dihydro-3-hydroxyanthranilate isomerase
MRSFSYILLDVFTSQALAGNQLAVFTDGRGLSDAEMQMLAKETNLSETTFIIPRDAAVERERGVQVRIFTTQEELPFAGHPTLGTATVLRRNKEPKIELDLRVGKIPVTFEERCSEPAFGEMVQRNPEFGAIHKASDIAAIAGLRPEDFESELPIQTVSTGMAFMIAPVKSLERIQAIDYQASVAKKYLEHSDAKFIFFVCKQTVDPQARLHARMIFYNGEDPATGSASGCAAAWMAKYGVAASNERVLIEQGIEMGRPSRIFVSAQRTDDQVVNVCVGGQAIEVARGEFKIP